MDECSDWTPKHTLLIDPVRPKNGPSNPYARRGSRPWTSSLFGCLRLPAWFQRLYIAKDTPLPTLFRRVAKLAQSRSRPSYLNILLVPLTNGSLRNPPPIFLTHTNRRRYP